jgi:hypothetical protein
MAAVIELHTGKLLPDGSDDRRDPHAPPALRLIQGGRSHSSRRMQRVYLWRRLVALVGVLAVVLVLFQVIRLAAMPLESGSSVPAPRPDALHQVQPGDTLWALASAVDPSADPRAVIHEIQDLNAGNSALSDDGQLRVGQTLRLPIGN